MLANSSYAAQRIWKLLESPRFLRASGSWRKVSGSHLATHYSRHFGSPSPSASCGGSKAPSVGCLVA